jgi:hypothetical protein
MRDKARTREESKKGLWSSMIRKPLIILVPEVGIEPTLSQGKGDFESPASTSFTTPARAPNILSRHEMSRRKEKYFLINKNIMHIDTGF